MPKSLGTLTAPALATAPAVGVAGALYYNTTDNALYKSNGSAWSAVDTGGGGGAPTISDTPPGSPTAGMLWWESDTGSMFIYYDSTWVEIGGGPPGPIGQSAIPWTKTGTIAVATGSLRFPLPFDGVILGVSARVGTAPTGADIIIDVNKNGTTIFTTQANRPKILAGASSTAAEVTNMNVTTFVAGDYLTVDIDQVGSTVAGADLTVVVRYRDAYGAIAETPGLVLVAKTDFSAASTVSVDSCFTSTYANYRVVVALTGSTSITMQMRLRVSSTDNSAASYNIRGTYQAGATGRYAVLAATYFDLGLIDASQSLIVMDALSPAIAQATGLSYISYGQDTHVVASGRHDVATAYDGLTLIASTGTITGTVTVYGYRNNV